MTTFYRNFLFYCNRIGKSPTSVIEASGLKKSANTSWANGSIPTRANLLKIAEELNVTPDDLFQDATAGASMPQPPQEYAELTPENRSIVDSLILSLRQNQRKD